MRKLLICHKYHGAKVKPVVAFGFLSTYLICCDKIEKVLALPWELCKPFLHNTHKNPLIKDAFSFKIYSLILEREGV